MQTAPQTQPQTTSEILDFERLLAKPSASLSTYVDKSSDPVKAIESFGNWIAKSGMFGCTKPEQGMVIAIACIEMRIGLVEFSQTFDIMHNGKLRKKALAAQVEFENLGGGVRWLDTGEGRDKATVELTWKGQSRQFTFTIDEARKAGLVKKDGNWESWTSEMLCARVLSRGIARLCPRVYAGFESDDSADVVPTTSPLPLPAKPAPAPAPAPAPVAKAPEPVPQPAPAAEPAPVAAPETAPAPAATEDFPTTEEQAEAVAAAIGFENVVKAVKWMARQMPPWLTAEQAATPHAFRYLTAARRERILNKREMFIRAISNPSPTS